MAYERIGVTAGTNGIGHWKVNRPMNIKPVITGTVKQDGKTFYVDGNGKQYESEVFNRVWGKPVEKVEKKRKGKSICKP